MSTEVKNVKNHFKFGGVEFRLVTDEQDNPYCLVSVGALQELIQKIEPLLNRGVCDGSPSFGSFTELATTGFVYNGLCSIAKDLDSLKLVTLPLQHNIFYGILSSKPSADDKLKYKNKTVFASGKFYYFTDGLSDYAELSPQRGRPYYNTITKSWYGWNGSNLVPLNEL